MKKVRVDYFFELYEKGKIPKVFSEVNDLDEKTIVNTDYNKDQIEYSKTVYSVFFVMDYLKPTFDTNLYSKKTIRQFFKGYTISLDNFDSADAYVKYRFRSNAKGIRRRIKRLETCFDISYKTYFGAIKQEEYDILMNELKAMLIRRFEQRNDISQSLLRWDYYKNLYFSLINQKKASLFVIYSNDTPIMISLNHHFYERLFSAISSYDIDYGKFSLGSVEIYKKLEWCIANNHRSYEMGMGDLSYKREWCNHIYNFEHQIIYPKKSIRAYIYMLMEYIKVNFKEFVFKIAYVKYKEFKAKRKKKLNFSVPQYESLPIEEAIRGNENYKEIDYNTEEFIYLRKKVFDFLYSGIEHVSDVKVLKKSKKELKESYLIIGKTKMQQVIEV
ncbi:GNAT family N-acetyltransferase [Aquimarina aquimarini]|uniref:GNAT family N-acetyltransferase n=1 Tax=Aquimarina aquimarini TaxID=1191734 RepID=UPI000D558D72|nr:GNAT family N-acetyltransferase [Aquimarina aquimarini]